MKLATPVLATIMATLALAKPPPADLCPNERTMLPCRNYCKTRGQSGGFCIPTKKGDLFSPKICKCYGGSGIEQRDDDDESGQEAFDKIQTILDNFPIISIDEIEEEDEPDIAARSELGKRKCHMLRVCVGVWKAKLCTWVEVC